MTTEQKEILKQEAWREYAGQRMQPYDLEEQSLRDEVKDRYISWHYFHQIDDKSSDTVRTWKKYLQADKALKDYLVKTNKHIPIKSDPSLVIEDYMITVMPIRDALEEETQKCLSHN